MNAQIFKSLKPGGLFLVIDHSTEAGSGDRGTNTLHRVDEALVRDELLAAGFELFTTSNLLRNEADQRDLNVFDAAIRGDTDLFLMVFQKQP